ncbi:MAG: esterase-like activity of phytase family protein [Epsilonproteobacteria bacterium]|nr:MAG: esterase-like activity of phytase family protein [Campylobacterota bacterium]
MPHIFIIFLLSTLLQAQMKPVNFMPPSQKSSNFMGIRILDAKVLSFKPKNGIAFTEVSALAYDPERSRLYGLSDHGYLYHLIVTIKQEKLAEIKLLEAYKLRNKKGKRLKKSKRDSEGLDVTDKGLLIAFERNPRVSLFSRKGKEIKEYSLHKKLRNVKHYQDKNDALEAVTVHPKYGILTVPEIPLKKHDKTIHTLYAKKKMWRFKAKGFIKAIETMEDGAILVLEKSYKSSKKRRVVALTKVDIEGCKSKLCPSETVALFDTKDGWQLDNFEGMTRLEHNRYLMISDDNDSPKQKCILVLFDITKGHIKKPVNPSL